MVMFCPGSLKNSFVGLLNHLATAATGVVGLRFKATSMEEDAEAMGRSAPKNHFFLEKVP